MYKVFDPNPSKSILPILKDHLGQSIMVVVYRNGRPRKTGMITEGEHAGETYDLRQQYTVPATERGVNTEFRGRHWEGWFFDWATGSNAIFHLRRGDEIRVFPAEHIAIVDGHHPQSFAQGVNHCVFQPMIKWAENKFAEAVSKQARSNYKCYLRKLHAYALTYEAGVPEGKIQEIVSDLGK